MSNYIHGSLPTEQERLTRLNDLINRPLQGLSKWSYNLIGMYEHAGLSLRAAYNWRSSFLIDYSERRDFTTEQPSGIQWPYVLQQQVRPVGRLDLSASYALTTNFTLFGDLTNVLSKPVKVNLIRTEATGARFDPSGPQTVFPFQYRYEERILSVGGRFRF